MYNPPTYLHRGGRTYQAHDSKLGNSKRRARVAALDSVWKLRSIQVTTSEHSAVWGLPNACSMMR